VLRKETSSRQSACPALLKQARPLREFVKVDLSLPGCPPPSKAIFSVINDLLDGKKPDAALKVKFR
jgi:NAD-reducing hydrogenase small subunit